MGTLSCVCVFCGSRAGTDPAYEAQARTLGQQLAKRRIKLVYGAGSTGLMGALADANLAAGGQAVGVVPKFLVDREVAHDNLSERLVVRDMHTRKARMFQLADAFCVLPGGIGTLEEAFEMVTWKQLGRHHKPVVVANVAGYWNPLLATIEQTVARGFADEGSRDLWTVVDRVEDVIPTIEKILDR